MIIKLFTTAFMAANFLAGSEASPCKARVVSLTTDVSTTLEATLTETRASITTTAEASTTHDSITASDISITGHMSTEEDITIVTGSESNSQTSTTAEITSSIGIPTIEQLTSTVADSTTSSVAEPTTTMADGFTTTMTASTTATETSTTEASTTTTTDEAPASPTFLINAGFEDASLEPWVRYIDDETTLSIDSQIKHDGQQSCRLDWAQVDDPFSIDPTTYNYITQPLPQTPEAGVSYIMSTWFRVSAEEDGTTACPSTFIRCIYNDYLVASDTAIQRPTAEQWQQMSTTCTYTQEQIDSGGLYLFIGFTCNGGAQSWVDTASFERTE